MGFSKTLDTVAIQGIHKFAVYVLTWTFGLTFVEPTIAAVANKCNGKIIDLEHLFSNAVAIVESTTNASMGIYERKVMCNSVDLAKIAVCNVTIVEAHCVI